jgi:hypothetical protein
MNERLFEAIRMAGTITTINFAGRKIKIQRYQAELSFKG